MLSKVWRYTSFRNFSISTIRRNVEKKPAETSTSTNASPQGYMLAKMPSNFEKKILVYSGRYKTFEEIPKLVTPETLENASSKLRIKIANLMILVTVIACGVIIYQGKASRKEKIKKWEEKEAIKAEQKKLAEQQH